MPFFVVKVRIFLTLLPPLLLNKGILLIAESGTNAIYGHIPDYY
jgi:hypothetical protein